VSKIPGMGELAGKGVEAISKMRERLGVEIEPKEPPGKEAGKEPEAGSLLDLFGSEMPKEPEAGSLLDLFGSEMPKATRGQQAGAAGDGGAKARESELTGTGGDRGGKSITMNLDITNYFNVEGEFDVDRIADQLIGKINDRLRDAAIALG